MSGTSYKVNCVFMQRQLLMAHVAPAWCFHVCILLSCEAIFWSFLRDFWDSDTFGFWPWAASFASQPQLPLGKLFLWNSLINVMVLFWTPSLWRFYLLWMRQNIWIWHKMKHKSACSEEPVLPVSALAGCSWASAANPTRGWQSKHSICISAGILSRVLLAFQKPFFIKFWCQYLHVLGFSAAASVSVPCCEASLQLSLSQCTTP